jgi:hypothetical protein
MEEKAPEVNVGIELTVTEVNNVLAALAKFPFEQVADLIQKVRNQAIAQLPASDADPAAAE